MIKYTILKANNREVLIEQVNTALALNWQLDGNFVCVVDLDGIMSYMQPMTRTIDVINNSA